MMKHHVRTVLTGCSLALSASVFAQALARDDSNFMQQAAQNSHAEVESGKLAQSKSANPQVKSFANRMVEDHARANDELAKLATAKGVDLPREASVLQRTKLKAMSALEGTSFDRQYADEMGVQAHQETIELFKKAASGAQDPELKSFATKTLPTLQQHLDMARQLKRTVGEK